METIKDSVSRLIDCLEDVIVNFKNQSKHKDKAKNLLKRVKRLKTSPANDYLLKNLDVYDREYIQLNLEIMEKTPATVMEVVVADLNNLERIYELIEDNIKSDKN